MRDVTKKAAAALEARIPNIATLEAKIRDLINPAPERRADCLFQIQRALFHVKIPPLGPRPPSTAAERELLEQILKGLRTVKVALNALGADGATLGPDSVGTHVGYAEVQRYYEYVEKLLASRASRPRPRDWPKRDPAMLAAVAEAAGLLRVSTWTARTTRLPGQRGPKAGSGTSSRQSYTAAAAGEAMSTRRYATSSAQTKPAPPSVPTAGFLLLLTH